jgi:hypothetical protein
MGENEERKIMKRAKEETNRKAYLAARSVKRFRRESESYSDEMESLVMRWGEIGMAVPYDELPPKPIVPAILLQSWSRRRPVEVGCVCEVDEVPF